MPQFEENTSKRGSWPMVVMCGTSCEWDHPLPVYFVKSPKGKLCRPLAFAGSAVSLCLNCRAMSLWEPGAESATPSAGGTEMMHTYIWSRHVHRAAVEKTNGQSRDLSLGNLFAVWSPAGRNQPRQPHCTSTPDAGNIRASNSVRRDMAHRRWSSGN
jgi:hypothetical protein